MIGAPGVSDCVSEMFGAAAYRDLGAVGKVQSRVMSTMHVHFTWEG